jgi:hypothetical protein
MKIISKCLGWETRFEEKIYVKGEINEKNLQKY